MKNIKIDTNYIPPSDESIDAAMDFDALLKRNEQHKAKNVFGFRPYAVAASVALAFMAVSVMAYIIIEQQKENILPIVQIKKKQNKDIPVEKKATIPLEPQWFLIDNSKDSYIETKKGKVINFSALSFSKTKSNKILVNISEVSSGNYLNTHFNNGLEAIYLYAFAYENKMAVQLLKPLTCSWTAILFSYAKAYR